VGVTPRFWGSDNGVAASSGEGGGGLKLSGVGIDGASYELEVAGDGGFFPRCWSPPFDFTTAPTTRINRHS
jgi:hypothetical protein